MPINERLDEENVAHITMKYYAAIKKNDVLCRDMDEAGNDHSQQTNTGRENET